MGKVVAVALACASCVSLATGCGETKRNVARRVSVPYLIGRDTLAAQALLEQRGLRWRWEEGVRPGIANGFIAETIEGQSPPNGRRVTPGTVVVLSPGSLWYVGGHTTLNPYG
jgi:beta-lactam-binding protein with PASTA domain